MPEEVYVFTDQTYQRLAAAAIRPLSVTDVLFGRHRVRRHIGAAFQVAGRDRSGTWLAVALIEGEDDEYTVICARYLDEAEIEAVGRMGGRANE
ncbi:hypothetical protein [Krasilnikovia sp. MM14-A1259]|uniref:hypothetical protein n=1 Tax=Krasilnikovia sp. MM14-A1259 TaxID=3373539 RepID=UPI00399D2E47